MFRDWYKVSRPLLLRALPRLTSSTFGIPRIQPSFDIRHHTSRILIHSIWHKNMLRLLIINYIIWSSSFFMSIFFYCLDLFFLLHIHTFISLIYLLMIRNANFLYVICKSICCSQVHCMFNLQIVKTSSDCFLKFYVHQMLCTSFRLNNQN